MKSKSQIYSLILTTIHIAAFTLSLTACGTVQSSETSQDKRLSRQTFSDPYQSLNRKTHAFNLFIDKYFAKPISTGYDKLFPRPVKIGVSNFFNNLGEPLDISNNLLQGKFDRALESTYRLVVNSTIGILGFVDVASRYGVEPVHEDFNQTLSAWGLGTGPYIVLPLLGPSTLRDTTGRIIDMLTFNPYEETTSSAVSQYSLLATYGVSYRASLLSASEVLDGQLDPYGFLKSAYQQSSIKEIYDGAAPQFDSIDDDDFDF